MAELEVSSADVVRLVLQFLRENGLRESFRVLQEEAQQGLNAVDNVAAFLSDIKAGRWETVLPQVAEMRLPVEVVQDLLELVLLELLDLKDRDAARSLLSDPDPALLLMRSHSTDRFLRLERLVNKPSPDPHDLFGDIPKEQRRLDLSKAIEKELDDVAPSRLMVLIDQALRWQRHQGLLPLGQEFDLFKGEMLQLQTEDEAPPSFESAKIKFGKGVRCESIVFSPDGQYLVSGSSDGFLEVWNYLTGKLRKDLDYQTEDKFMSHSEAVLALCFSEDSELVASGCLNGQIKVWDIKSGKCVRRFDRAHQKGISCLSFSKDGSLLLSGSFDETLKVHGMKGGTTLKTMAGHTSYVNHCGWMEEGKVVSASSDGSVKVWDVKTSTCLLSLCPGSGSLSEASVFKALPLPSHPDRLLVCNHSPALSLLSLRDSQVIGTFVSATDEDPKGSDFVDCVLSPKGDWIFALTENGNLFSFRTNSPEAQSVLKVHDKSPTSVVHHPHRNIIATNGDEGLVKLWKP